MSEQDKAPVDEASQGDEPMKDLEPSEEEASEVTGGRKRFFGAEGGKDEGEGIRHG